MCFVLLVVCGLSLDCSCVLFVGCRLLPVALEFVGCLLSVGLVVVCWLLIGVRCFGARCLLFVVCW